MKDSFIVHLGIWAAFACLLHIIGCDADVATLLGFFCYLFRWCIAAITAVCAMGIGALGFVAYDYLTGSEG